MCVCGGGGGGGGVKVALFEREMTRNEFTTSTGKVIHCLSSFLTTVLCEDGGPMSRRLYNRNDIFISINMACNRGCL